jgi:hypothetical protein
MHSLFTSCVAPVHDLLQSAILVHSPHAPFTFEISKKNIKLNNINPSTAINLFLVRYCIHPLLDFIGCYLDTFEFHSVCHCMDFLDSHYLQIQLLVI